MLVTDGENYMEFIALRTVAVYLKNGNRTVKVNALLDDASTRSYINNDVTAELGLEGKPEQLTVQVLDNNHITLERSTVDVVIEGYEWKNHSSHKCPHYQPCNWEHLKKIPIVDI